MVSAVAGGVAGPVAQKAIEFLGEFFHKHSPAAREESEKRAMVFLASLAQRIDLLENANPGGGEKISSALADPDFNAVLDGAVRAAVRTGSREKQEILANTVAERLVADPESTVALSMSAATDTIARLSGRHLTTLCVMTLVGHPG
jgi:hypothetical protein